MSLAVSRVICHCLVTEHRSHAVIIRPITRSLEESKPLLQPRGDTLCAVYPRFSVRPGSILSILSHDLTCASSCSSPAPPWSATPSAAGGCWSTGRGPWRWWPSWWSPAPAHIRWNSGWRKYCALPAMRNKQINKKAKAPLMMRSSQLDCNTWHFQVHCMKTYLY